MEARRTVAYTIASNHVQNNLPIYLIYLPDMTLLRRNDVMSHLEPFIDSMSRESKHMANSKEWHEQASSVVMAETEYAILSHRWLNKGELSFRDLVNLRDISMAGFQEACANQRAHSQFTSAKFLALAKDLSTGTTSDGSRNGAELLEALADFCSGLSADAVTRFGGLIKLVEFCIIAVQQERKYVWMDTCCIDKSRSAELEESIRSMFRWYRNAKICIVHLADTHTSMFYMRRDAWFTRGWTLQELLAPGNIKFFDTDWCPLTNNPNDKIPDIDHAPLWRTISEITGINIGQLLDFTPGMHNIREIMVCASKRQTTRIEDAAYSLIGMLDVPLSIAYGEGPMAFYRLQVEIVQRSPDKGIFAWQGEPSAYNSMFAASPACFSPAIFNPLPMVKAYGWYNAPDHTHALTNFGLCIPLPLYDAKIVRSEGAGRGGPKQREYELKAQGLGTISVVSRDTLSAFDGMKVAILGDGEPGKSLAMLLGYRGDQYKSYKRVATQGLIWVDRLHIWGPTKTIYII